MTSSCYQFVDVGGLATHVLCFGVNISSRARPGRLVLFIPGNPGVVGFYENFLSRLYTELGGSVSVWAVGHAGHTLSENYREPHSGELEIDTLSGQIEHKRAFIRRYISPRTEVYLVGHSIGAYMCVHLSAEARPVSNRMELAEADVRPTTNSNFLPATAINDIKKLRLVEVQSEADVGPPTNTNRLPATPRNNTDKSCLLKVESEADGRCSYSGEYLLFPTLHEMRASPQGRRCWPLLQHGVFIAVLTSYIVKLLFPRFILRWLCSLYLYFCCGGDRPSLSPLSPLSPPASALQQLIQQPAAVGHILKLARDELLHVRALNECCHCLPMASKCVPTVIYWGTRDDWAPLSYTVPVIEFAPEAKLVVCKNNLAHCFSLSLNGSRVCAINVAEWIRSLI